MEVPCQIVKSKLISPTDDLMSDDDLKPLHLKNRLLFLSPLCSVEVICYPGILLLLQYLKLGSLKHRFFIVNNYIRKWLEVPISGTVSNAYLTNNKFGLNILLTSVKFIHCQSVLFNALKSSPKDSIKELWNSTNNHTTSQYDNFTSTKDVLKMFYFA